MAYVANHASAPRQSIIPTFIDNMPPSPTKKQASRQVSASSSSQNNKGKRQNTKVTPASITSHLPSVVMEQYAEDDRVSYYPSSYSSITQSQSAEESDSDDETSDESSPERPSVSSSAVSASTSQPVYIQVMLRLNEQQEIPINIPANVILPTLVSALSGNQPASYGHGGGSAPSTPVTLPIGVAHMGSRTSSTGDLKQNATHIDQNKKHPLTTSSSALVTASLPKIPRLSVPISPAVLPSPPPLLRYYGTAPRQAAPTSTLVHKTPTVSSSVSSPCSTSTKRDLSSESDGEYSKNQQTNNRAAASRCRQKKKQQIEEMERKTKALQQANKSLEDEMEALKSEIEQYETLLSDHVDCINMSSVYYITPS